MGPVRGFKKRKRGDRKVVVASENSGDWWDGFVSRVSGPLSKGPLTFEYVIKISRKTFNYICSLVRDDMMSKASKRLAFKDGRVLSLDEQVAIALRRLNSGETLSTIGSAFGLNHSTVSQITWRFIESMERRGMHHLKWPSYEEMQVIKSKFEKVHGLPNCCGIINTAHIVMCLPTVDSSNKVWIDQNENYSMILQVITDTNMRFLDIVTGWPGSMNEQLVLQSSGFFKMCEKGTRLNGEKIKLSEGSEVRDYIIGDAGFPLLPWLITPFQENALSDSEAEFNKRHFSTRMVAKRALDRLKGTWQIVHGQMWRPDKHRLPRIILVCCLLHNIMIDMEDETKNEMPLSPHHDLTYKKHLCNVADDEGVSLRDKLSRYLSGKLLT